MTGGIHGYDCVCGGHDSYGSRSTGGVYSSVAANTYGSYNVAPMKEERQYSTQYYGEPATCIGTPLILQDAQPVTRRASVENTYVKTTRPMTSFSLQHGLNSDLEGMSYREPPARAKSLPRPRTASYGRPIPRDYNNFVNDASSKYWQVMGEHSAKGKFFDRSRPTYHGPCCQRCHCRPRSLSPDRSSKPFRTTYDDDFNRNYRTSRNNGFMVTQPSGKHGTYYTGAGGYNGSYWAPAAKYSQLASQLYSNRPVHGYTYRTTYNDDYNRPSGKRATFRNYSYQSGPKVGSNWSRGCCCNLQDHAWQMMSRSYN